MRVARSLGVIDGLVPQGLSLDDCPYPLFDAISRALLILNWQENLLTDEMPHRLIWHDDERLSDHFAALDKKRKAESDGRSVWDDSNSKQNDLAKSLVVE